MKNRINELLWCGLALSTVTYGFADERWPQFRGPDGQGHATEASIPAQFGVKQGVRWRAPIAGKAWSSPVISDGRIWLTTAITEAATDEEKARKLADDPLKAIKDVAGTVEFQAICVDFATGNVVHEISLAKVDDPEPINPLNTYASPTPVIAGGRVYCHFGNYGTWCLNAEDGAIVWQRQIVVDYSVGPGSSPYVHGDKLILVCDGTDQQFVMALDAATGKEVWKTPRPPIRATEVEYRKAYSTPIAVQVRGETQLIVPGAQWICAYAPDTGREIWRIDHGDGFSVSPRPIAVGDLVVFSTGYMKPELVAVKTDGQGDVSQTHVAWRVSRGAPSKPSPIAVGDRIFVVNDLGVLTQLRSADGSILWQHRLGGQYSASPIQAGDKLVFCSHTGAVTVVAVDAQYRELAKNELEAAILASPAVVGDDLLIRTENELLRIGK